VEESFIDNPIPQILQNELSKFILDFSLIGILGVLVMIIALSNNLKIKYYTTKKESV